MVTKTVYRQAVEYIADYIDRTLVYIELDDDYEEVSSTLDRCLEVLERDFKFKGHDS